MYIIQLLISLLLQLSAIIGIYYIFNKKQEELNRYNIIINYIKNKESRK